MLGFVAASGFFVVLFAFTLLQLMFSLGGSNETRNAVDSGTLAVSRDVTKIKTTAQSDVEAQYNDVADKDNEFGLTNINRVWAKALLVRMNAAAMEQENTGSGQSSSNANALFDSAERISDRIADQLNDQNALRGYFDSVATQNSARMLGNQASIHSHAGNNWKTSLMDRGEESNIIIHAQQLPGEFAPDNSIAKQADDGELHIKGYAPITVLGRSICLVPFKVNQKPHMVSNKTFTDNTKQSNPLPQWNNPVPNAFSCEGQSKGQTNHMHSAVSFALSNPETNFQLAIPHAFVSVKFEDNTVKWYANAIPHGSNSYDFHTDIQVRQFEAGAGTMTVTATLGNEYMPPTLQQAIHAIPGHNYNDVDRVLLQRVREIKHDYSQADLTAALNECPFIGTQEYVIFPLADGTLKAAPKGAANGFAPWINANNDADGSEKSLSGESIWEVPNTVQVVLVGPGPKPAPSFTHETGDIHWRPGTGFGGCLGQLRIERTTEVYANGACSIF